MEDSYGAGFPGHPVVKSFTFVFFFLVGKGDLKCKLLVRGYNFNSRVLSQ